MSFILRAALVIGTLSYLAAQRDGELQPAAELRALAERQAPQITALAGALPLPMRDAAAQAVSAEIMKRLATEAASRDTLLAVDRRPEWRGTDRR